MLTISKPLSAGQAQTYHKEEFANAQENYYSEGERIRGEWNGKLAEEWGLRGEVQEEHFQRLANGQHPLTGEQLVRHQTAREYVNARGETVSTMEHRAALGRDVLGSQERVVNRSRGWGRSRAAGSSGQRQSCIERDGEVRPSAHGRQSPPGNDWQMDRNKLRA